MLIDSILPPYLERDFVTDQIASLVELPQFEGGRLEALGVAQRCSAVWSVRGKAEISNSRGQTETQALWVQDAWRFAPVWKLTTGILDARQHTDNVAHVYQALPISCST
jgi:hypothetical protein